ncbi:MAG: membrane protein insertion efficiency factor YidD [Acidobacteriaceae bacterium]
MFPASKPAERQRRAARAEALLTAYKRWFSPALHGLAAPFLPVQASCRYQPTCSEYAAVAIARYGWLRGTLMAAGRVLRCNPWGRGGFDPVP